MLKIKLKFFFFVSNNCETNTEAANIIFISESHKLLRNFRRNFSYMLMPMIL